MRLHWRRRAASIRPASASRADERRGSWVADHDLPNILADDDDVSFTLGLCVKDLRLIGELEAAHGYTSTSRPRPGPASARPTSGSAPARRARRHAARGGAAQASRSGRPADARGRAARDRRRSGSRRSRSKGLAPARWPCGSSRAASATPTCTPSTARSRGRCRRIFGHEGAGVVEAVGAGVTNVAPGDHVILTWLPYCGACRMCTRGRPNLCEMQAWSDAGTMMDGRSGFHGAGRADQPLHRVVVRRANRGGGADVRPRRQRARPGRAVAVRVRAS